MLPDPSQNPPSTVPENALSRDAEVAAVSVFGITTELRFQRPQIIHPRLRAALDQLTRAGLLAQEEDRGALIWRPTPEMGSPFKRFRLPEPHESFPFTTE